MSHIHTGPGEHDHTVTAFIVRTDGTEPKLLLHMHKKLGTLLPPGGHIELNETPWQAVLHEIIEESGYHLDQLRLLQPVVRLRALAGAVLHPQTVVHDTHVISASPHYHTDVSYAFVTNDDPMNHTHDGESADLRWHSLQELRDLDDAEIIENVRQIGEFVLTEVIKTWEPVDTGEFQA
jgi:8-oxo-dGTP diphosphatase